MIELPKPNEGENLGDYIKRLLDEKIITGSQIPLAVKNFNK
jgi:hypothetical protein